MENEYKQVLRRDISILEDRKARIDAKLSEMGILDTDGWFEDANDQTKAYHLLKQLQEVEEEIQVKKDELGELE